MSQHDLVSILQALQDNPENITQFDESWSQGRSAFGGIASAFAVTAMRKQLESAQPIRSLLVSFVAPIPPGIVAVNTRIQRRGKNVTQMTADVVANGEIGLQAMGVFGNPRAALSLPPASIVDLLPREQGIPFATHAKRLPHFLAYFEGCWVDGGMPFSGTKKRHLAMWVKHRTDMTAFPAEKIVTICDIPPPVILSHFDTPPVPASSLTWSLEFVVPPETVNSDWFYLDFQLDAAADGYTQQSGRIFDDTGRLCALSRQCMVYFG